MPETESEGADEAESEEEQKSPLDDKEYLQELYHEQDLTQAEIGEKHGVTASTVSHYMKKHEIKTRATQVTDERLDDPEWLRNEYLSEEDGGKGESRTMMDIAEEVGCSDGTVMRRLRKHGIIEEPSDDEEAEEEADDDEE